jgi:hypothetical protein
MTATPHGFTPTATIAVARDVLVSMTETELDRPFATYSVPPSVLSVTPHGRRPTGILASGRSVCALSTATASLRPHAT